MTRAPAVATRRDGRIQASPARTASWRTVDITPAERVGRMLIGLAGIIAGAVLLAGAASVLAFAFEALLIAAGLDLAVTGALGHCPLYAKLGHIPRALRESR